MGQLLRPLSGAAIQLLHQGCDLHCWCICCCQVALRCLLALPQSVAFIVASFSRLSSSALGIWLLPYNLVSCSLSLSSVSILSAASATPATHHVLLVSLSLLVPDLELIRGLCLLHNHHLVPCAGQPLSVAVVIFLREATVGLVTLQPQFCK